MADVAVLGGGHGSYAAAADLTRAGHRVTLWRRDRLALEDLRRDPVVAVQSSEGDFEARLHRVTADIGEAVAGARLILVPLPATAHEDLAELLSPYLRDDQVVYLTPGTFGSFLMAKRVNERGNGARVAFAETGTLPYLTRKHGPRLVSLTTRATHLPTGVFPADRTDRALAVIREAFPCAHPVEDALSAALLNAGPVIHPPLLVMNAGPLDRSKDFDIHNEGTQRAIRQVADRLDGERMALRDALGYRSHHYPLRDHYEGKDWLYGPKSHSGVVKSGNWREPIDLRAHRYMREDVQLGLGFMTSVARWAGVAAPIAEGLLALGGAICDEDFTQGPRSWRALGLEAESRERVRHLLAHGLG